MALANPAQGALSEGPRSLSTCYTSLLTSMETQATGQRRLVGTEPGVQANATNTSSQ